MQILNQEKNVLINKILLGTIAYLPYSVRNNEKCNAGNNAKTRGKFYFLFLMYNRTSGANIFLENYFL